MSKKKSIVVDDLLKENYIKFTKIARGGFGDIYKGEHHKLMNENHAIKIQSGTKPKHRREIQLLSECNHPNILPVIYALSIKDQVYMITPLFKMNLHYLLRSQKNIPLEMKVSIFLDILKGINYLHEHGIMHLDLKPLNILVDEHYNCVLADFGLTKIKKPIMTDSTYYTSHLYTSPERSKGTKADFADDIWSLGCTLYEILEGGQAYPNNLSKNLSCQKTVGGAFFVNEILQPAFEEQRINRISLAEMTRRFVEISFGILKKPIPESMINLIQR